mgnify:CR=1 FL=1
MQIRQRVTSSNNPCALDKSPVQGNLLRAWVYADTQTPPASPGDWTLIASAGQAGGPVSLALYAKLADGDEGTIALDEETPPTQYRIEIVEFGRGLAEWEAPRDAFIDAAVTHGSGVQSNSISTPEITVPSKALVEAAMGCTAGSMSFAVSSPFAIRSEIGGRLVVADTEGDGTHQASFTFNNNRHWAAGIAALEIPPRPPRARTGIWVTGIWKPY